MAIQGRGVENCELPRKCELKWQGKSFQDQARSIYSMTRGFTFYVSWPTS